MLGASRSTSSPNRYSARSQTHARRSVHGLAPRYTRAVFELGPGRMSSTELASGKLISACGVDTDTNGIRPGRQDPLARLLVLAYTSHVNSARRAWSEPTSSRTVADAVVPGSGPGRTRPTPSVPPRRPTSERQDSNHLVKIVSRAVSETYRRSAMGHIGRRAPLAN